MKVPSKKSDTEQFYRAVILGYRTITGTDRSPIIEYGCKDRAPGFIFGSYILEWLRQIHHPPHFYQGVQKWRFRNVSTRFFRPKGFWPIQNELNSRFYWRYLNIILSD